MSVLLPDPTTRWRCGACGNLTRFDVTRSSRVVEYVHLDLAGVPRVEERTVLEETVEQVRCRWCDRGDRIELVPRTDTADTADTADPADSADAVDAVGD
ncbi:MAG: hypothetical protein WAL50_15425 [Kineosporiaceae bacterium]